MGDFSVQLTAEKFGKSLENAGEQIEAQINDAVRDLATAAHASMVSQIQATKMDPKNRQDMLRGLNFTDLGDNSYVIDLQGDWANKLEDGFPGYDMKQDLLSSKKKVSVGSRAGEDWVREGKDGQKYAAVPFDHKPYAAGTGDMAQDIKKIMAKNRQGDSQSLTKTFKDDFGKPIAGKVASVKSDMLPEGVSKNLGGVTKYQHVHDSGKVSSIYMTFRIISENSNGWFHPGWDGHNFFEEAEKDVERELENIVKRLL